MRSQIKEVAVCHALYIVGEWGFPLETGEETDLVKTYLDSYDIKI